MSQIGSEEQSGLATVFYPLHRVERIALDEEVGNVPSLATTFHQRAGMTLSEYLDKYSGLTNRSESVQRQFPIRIRRPKLIGSRAEPGLLPNRLLQEASLNPTTRAPLQNGANHVPLHSLPTAVNDADL
jgi:hypothetical protein